VIAKRDARSDAPAPEDGRNEPSGGTHGPEPMPWRDAGRALQLQQVSREKIAQMADPAPKSPSEKDARGIIRHDMAERRQAEVFRDLRTQLLSRAQGRNFITLVAPVSHSSGASFVSANLAAAFAFGESKTALLIDCNLRKPVLHEHLGVRPEHGGLTDFLDHPAIGIDKIIYPTGVARLRLIPAGQRRESSGEYFTSFRMRGLVDLLRSRYPDRYLILDAPAIRTSPDARILAELADIAVVVAGYAVDTTAAIKEAVAVLEPGTLAGVVFNGVP
jgi:Mrp family chromosome partitioning ATPase